MNNRRNEKAALSRTWLMLGSLISMFSIIIGAFAAHALKASLSDYQLNIVDTGAQYQMYSGFSILIVSILYVVFPMTLRNLHIVNGCFASACVLFSGSLYLLATTGIKVFAYFTPLGGTLFIIGWCVLIGVIYNTTNPNKSSH